mmetsp:Transcript_82368/g.266743  ORF Transcript_82368/g.266743 Transcript_82368/m.266743 type:complete len:230 (+) Transcript_82368:284-973(+)
MLSTRSLRIPACLPLGCFRLGPRPRPTAPAGAGAPTSGDGAGAGVGWQGAGVPPPSGAGTAQRPNAVAEVAFAERLAPAVPAAAARSGLAEQSLVPKEASSEEELTSVHERDAASHFTHDELRLLRERVIAARAVARSLAESSPPAASSTAAPAPSFSASRSAPVPASTVEVVSRVRAPSPEVLDAGSGSSLSAAAEPAGAQLAVQETWRTSATGRPPLWATPKHDGFS